MTVYNESKLLSIFSQYKPIHVFMDKGNWFVQFDSITQRDEALKNLNKTFYEGSQLNLVTYEFEKGKANPVT